MVNFRSRRTSVAVNTVIGLMTLQLGLRGLVVLLNESGGNTYDVIGDVNGPKYWWLLIPESWTLDLVTRFSFWFLLPLSVVFFARAVVLARSDAPQRLMALRLLIAVLILVSVWAFLIASWGVVVVATHDAFEWSLPEFVFPTPLYLVIHRAWPGFLFIAIVGAYVAWRLRKGLSRGPLKD